MTKKEKVQMERHAQVEMHRYFSPPRLKSSNRNFPSLFLSQPFREGLIY